MGNDVNVKGTISIDTKDSAQQISNVKKGLNDVSATAKESHSNFSNLKESLGKLAPGLKDSSEGVGTLSTAFKALLANPVVLAIAAIVAALVGLYKAFTSTMEGAQKMEQVFEGIKSIMSVITDRLVTLGNAVVKLFSGDFKGAADAAKASVEGLSDAIGEAYTKTVEITKQLQKIRQEERADTLDRSVREKRLALLREQLNDESVSVKQRIAIAKELRDDQIKNAEEDKARTIKKSDLEIEKIKLKKNLTEEDYNEINKLEIEKNKVETENALEGVRTNKVIRNLQKQANAEAKAEIEEEKKAHDELIKKLEEEQKLRLKIWWSRQNDAVTFKQVRDEEAKAEAEKQAKIKKAEDDRLARQKEFLTTQMNSANMILQKGAEMSAQSQENAKLEIELANQRVSAYFSIGEAAVAIGRLIGEQTALGKGLSIAQATINTWVGVTEILKTKSILPEPLATISRIANITAVVASGLTAVRNIGRVQVPGASGGGSSASAMSVNSPIAPLQSSTAINSSSIQGIGSAAAGGVGRTFLLDADIKDSQERSARITRAARLG